MCIVHKWKAYLRPSSSRWQRRKFLSAVNQGFKYEGLKSSDQDSGKNIKVYSQYRHTCVALKSTLFPLILIRILAAPFLFAFSCLSLYLCKASEATRSRITTNSFVKNMCFLFTLLNFSMQEQKHLKYF